MAEKIFMTYSQQIKHLKSKGLYVSNSGMPKRVLANENYYNVINGYKELFIDNYKSTKDKEVYKNGSNFSELYALYKFDCELKAVLLKRILRIENTIKSVISYVFSEKYGHKDYLKSTNFDLVTGNIKRIENIERLIKIIEEQISEQLSKNNAIKHYMSNHTYIPLWVLMNILTLGNISAFYSLMKQSERQKVAKHFTSYKIYDSELKLILEVLSYSRNKCAHDERMFDFNSSSSLSNNNIHGKLSIPKNINGYIYGKKDLFSIIIIFKIFLTKSEFKKVITEIKSILHILSKELKVVGISEIKTKMGFPNNWEEIIKI